MKMKLSFSDFNHKFPLNNLCTEIKNKALNDLVMLILAYILFRFFIT